MGDSWYAKAQRDDEEVAVVLAAEVIDNDRPWTPPLDDWTLSHELMAQVRDRLGEMAALLADLPVGVKQRHTPPKPLPRPDTALDRAVHRLRTERDDAYDQKILDFAEQAKARWRAQQQGSDSA